MGVCTLKEKQKEIEKSRQVMGGLIFIMSLQNHEHNEAKIQIIIN